MSHGPSGSEEQEPAAQRGSDAGSTEVADELPPVVYIPSERVRQGTGEDTNVELRHLDDERLALLAFTSLERLVDGCGDHQPWVCIDSDQLEELQRVVDADITVLDGSLPEDIRHGASDE